MSDRRAEEDAALRAYWTASTPAQEQAATERLVALGIAVRRAGPQPPEPALSQPCQDPVVEAVVAKLRQRSTIGLGKYGTTLARTDLERRQWLRHALEEALDLANYLQRLLLEAEREG